MRVLVVTEYFPRRGDPARGVWAYRQALATRDAGVEVRVLVLHRPLPPLQALRRHDLDTVRREVLQPSRSHMDGLEVEYLRYVSPPRPWSYDSWGAWAAPWLGRRLRAVRRRFDFDLIHAHYAVPAGDAVRRAAPEVPMVLSVHGHDMFGAGSGGAEVQAALRHARLVLANSAGTAERCRAAGSRAVRVVHLGTDVPPSPSRSPEDPVLVTVAHLAARKRHEDVLGAVARLRNRYPGLRYVIVGDGPMRDTLEHQAADLGLGASVEFCGALDPAAARAVAARASLFVMPSVDEAFGVAYVEAMAAGVPAIGCRGEAGPEEIAAAGGGILLVAPDDPEGLAGLIDHQLSQPESLSELRRAARRTAVENFTWPGCGRATAEAYRQALARGAAAPDP